MSDEGKRSKKAEFLKKVVAAAAKVGVKSGAKAFAADTGGNLTDPASEVGAALVAESAGELVGEAAAIAWDRSAEWVARFRDPAGQRMLRAELESIAEEVVPKIEARAAEAQSEEEAAAVLNNAQVIASAWARARESTFDERKRRILRAVLIRAFDHDLYAEGLVLLVLERLGRLDYGAIRYLKQIADSSGEFIEIEGWTSIERFHMLQLSTLDFIHESRTANHATGILSELGRIALRYIEEGLVEEIRCEEKARASAKGDG